MKQAVKTALGAVLVASAQFGQAWAGPLEDGLTAQSRGDYATVIRLWRPLADQGNAHAQYNLGRLYDYGWGVPQDLVQAVKWYRLAAGQGNALAQVFFGTMYASGQRVPQDYAEAMKWYRLE